MSLWHALCLTKYTSIIKTDVSKWHNQWSSHFCATQEECYSNPDVSIPFVKSANTAFSTDYQVVASHSWSVEGGMVRGAHVWYLKLWLCRIVNCNIKVFLFLVGRRGLMDTASAFYPHSFKGLGFKSPWRQKFYNCNLYLLMKYIDRVRLKHQT